MVLLLALCFITSCAGNGGNPFAPKSPLAASVVAKWERELPLTDVTRITTKRERNDLVYRLIFLSDYRFSRYEADLMMGKATRDSFIDLSMFGLNAASTLVTPGSATRIMAAIAGGLGFSRSTIERNFYMNHTAPVLMAKMRALRKEKLNEIVRNLSREIDAYPASLAIIDVLDYYNRGTMLGALRSISNDTAIQEIEAEGGQVREPPKAPAIAAQIKLGMVVPQFRKTPPVVLSSKPPPLNSAAHTTEFSARRRALGGLVVVMRKQTNTPKALEILSAGNVTGTEGEPISTLGDIIDGISTAAELQKWERAFGVVSSGLVKTPPASVPGQVEALLPQTGTRAPAAPIPKTAPAEIQDKTRIEPL